MQVVLMYQPIASVYFRSFAASSTLFILFSSRTFKYRSVQNISKSAFYTNRFDLARLGVLSCLDMFPITNF